MKENPEKRRVFAEALDFNLGKLTEIINELFKARSSNKLMEKYLEEK